ncbi:MAG: hypothetical protein N2999_07055 [Proteobacteria bacterium]|nr:hypothetical protein [Pseudomonadota bacterium]
MKNLFFTLIFMLALTIKLSYEPKRGYYYTIQGDNPDEIIEADLKIKNYIRKGIMPNIKKDEKTK